MHQWDAARASVASCSVSQPQVQVGFTDFKRHKAFKFNGKVKTQPPKSCARPLQHKVGVAPLQFRLQQSRRHRCFQCGGPHITKMCLRETMKKRCFP